MYIEPYITLGLNSILQAVSKAYFHFIKLNT